MNSRPSRDHKRSGVAAEPPVSSRAAWARAIQSLNLCPQQARLVELLLRGKRDKEIAATMGLSIATVRTYLRRLFDRTGADDRMNLLLKIFDSACRQCEKRENQGNRA